MPSRSPKAVVASLAATLAVLGAACGLIGSTTTTTTTATTTTTTTTTTTIAFPERSTTSTTIGDGVDPEVAVTLQAEIAALIREAESIRGLQFVEDPAIAIVGGDEFRALLQADVATVLDTTAARGDELVYRLLGILDAETDLGELLETAYAAEYAGFYDGTAHRLVLNGGAGELTAIDRASLFHEIVHALTNQYFAIEDKLEEAGGAGPSDPALAFEALVEGDATYFQLVYVQGLSPTDRAAIARGSGPLPLPASAPVWFLDDLAFPYDAGLDFVRRLVDWGGIAAVDKAYLDPPISTEQVLHSDRYAIGEVVRPIPELDVTLAGYDDARIGSIGEWGLRRWLRQTLTAGVLTQTADGWGADAVATLRSGDDVAFVYTYAADSEGDAIEVALALVEHTRTTMGAGDGVEVDGGILFDEGSPWVFIDRIGDGLIYVAATDPAAGSELRSQVTVP